MTVPPASKMGYFRQGCLHVLKDGGKASSEGTSMNFMLLRRGIFCSSNSFLAGQCFAYWTHSYTTVSWGSWEWPPQNLLKANCLKRRKMPLQKIEEMERAQYEGQYLPLLPLPRISIPDYRTRRGV